jgi:hypothetical protein
VDQQIRPSVADMHEKTLSFDELKQWLQASVGQSFSTHIAIPRGIVAFLDGPIDTILGFNSGESHGLLVEGAGGAWTLQLPEPEFLSASLSPIPVSFTTEQLQIRMRDHIVVIDPATSPDPGT